MQFQPAARDRKVEGGLLFGRRGFQIEQERRVDLLDMDAAVLRNLDRIGDLDQFARGFIGVGIGALIGEFHSGTVSSSGRINSGPLFLTF